jgi:hypothetical protein
MNHASFAPAAFAVALLFGCAFAAPVAADPARLHGPIQPNRNDDGSLKHGRHSEIDTSNWSGYAVSNFETRQKYTAASGTWVVAPVIFGQTESGTEDEYSSSWVGVGGFCANATCTRSDNSLIQLGTESDVTQGGVATYSAWYEMLPKFPVTIPITIHANDQITAALQCTSPCSGKKQTWTLSMTNLTTGKNWSQRFTYASSLLSAEWIEEAPFSGGVLPLADFGVAPFTSPSASGGTLSLSLANNGIEMTDPWGQTANPSAPDGFDDFNVCWGFEALASCATPSRVH